MFNMFQLEGPPLFVQVYVDGRLYVKTPDPCTRRELALFELFKKGVKEKKIANMEPGHYDFNFTKIGRFRCEAELTLQT